MKSLFKRQLKVYKNTGICKTGSLSQGLSHASATFENLPKNNNFKKATYTAEGSRDYSQPLKLTATNKSTSFYAGCNVVQL